MITKGVFGVVDSLDMNFEERGYHHNKRANYIFRKNLEQLAVDGKWIEYVGQIRQEFDNQENEYLQIPKTTITKHRLQFLLWYIEHAEDLSKSLTFCEPRRYATDERVRYYVDKIFKRATQLDFQIQNHIIYLQREVIEILIIKGPCQIKANKFENVTNKSKMLISQAKEISDPIEIRFNNIGTQVPVLAKKQEKKGWRFWHKYK